MKKSVLFFRQDKQDLLDIVFGFPDESQKIQPPSAEKIVAIKFKFVQRPIFTADPYFEIYFRSEGGIGFRHFLLESGEEKKSR